ncbi:SPOR domain-containing protein [Photobacterium lipolyticum]|uniref:Cell division protein DedD n=1 Tax=Photobacterium lipolyticum TaxID=266810 RepID=A0A2T3MV97_9GAMM|nr:SPOR domain-containing protein [Photobacterium lipolyticum]PSW03886.1 cell division protein DedD [Photobacterium lipolyticum]
MASKFQSRLVGTIILVAIGVIFLPDLFDGKKQHYQEQFASIPLQPEVSVQEGFTTIPEPEFAEIELPQEPVTAVIDENGYEISGDSDIAKEEEPLAIAPQTVKPPKAGYQESGWVVQLGVFRNFDNAHQLVAKIRKAGFQAHVFPKQPKPGDLARVVVGPDVAKDKLASQIKDLEKLTGLKGQLLRFNPLNP